MAINSLFAEILNEINQRKSPAKAFVVGINGIDASGKTVFAKNFAEYLLVNNYIENNKWENPVKRKI
jgi:tRNA A37 threonylcarbamoyladenosine biosynthesis protein TsaE